MPAHECSSSEKRRGPSERSCTSSAVHFAPMISAQAATAQEVDSWTGFIVRIAIRIVVNLEDALGLATQEVPERGARGHRLDPTLPFLRLSAGDSGVHRLARRLPCGDG